MLHVRRPSRPLLVPLGLTLALTSAGLAACGSAESSGTGSSAASGSGSGTTVQGEATTPVSEAPASDPASDPAGEAGAAWPVTVEHTYGETEIAAEPERVVSVGFSDQDALLALGVVPVGIRDWYGDQPYGVWPWAQDELGDAQPTLLGSAELDYEAIAALQPDLIVGVYSGMTQEEYDLLSAIAPTVAQSGDFVDYGMPWQDSTLLIGQAVGKAAQARQLVDDTEALFAEAREAHPEFEGASAAVAFLFDGSPGAYASSDGRARTLGDLGFTTPAEYDEIAGDSFYASFSSEQIDLLDTDALVWIGSTPADIDAIKALPLREGLTAYAEGREVFVDPELAGAFSFSSVLSLPYLIEELVPELALAVDGDPATAVPSAQGATAGA